MTINVKSTVLYEIYKYSMKNRIPVTNQSAGRISYNCDLKTLRKLHGTLQLILTVYISYTN